MDPDTYYFKELLMDWGSKDYVENFEREGITDVSFLLFDELTIHSLIPKSGPRLIFKSKFKEYLQDKHNSIFVGNETTANASTDTLFTSPATTITDLDDSLYEYTPDKELSDLLESPQPAWFPLSQPSSSKESPTSTRSGIKRKYNYDSAFPSNVNKLHETIAERKEKLKKFGLTVQPFGVVVGNLDKPSFVIVVDDVQYTVDTCIRAIKLLFKLFHVLDVAYPPESEHVWFFIEQLVFKMKPKKTCPSATMVLSDVTYYLSKEK